MAHLYRFAAAAYAVAAVAEDYADYGSGDDDDAFWEMYSRYYCYYCCVRCRFDLNVATGRFWCGESRRLNKNTMRLKFGLLFHFRYVVYGRFCR